MSAVENPSSLAEATGWVGHKLDDISGSTAGRVEGVFVDHDSGEPVWLVIRIGRLGHRSAVPFELAAGGVGHVWVPFDRDTIRSAPEVDPGAGLDPAGEEALCAHFRLPADGRAAQVQGREEAFSAVPAPRD